MEASMSVEIRVPTLGESIVDAVIAGWLKHEGDQVNQGEALVELETDKVNVEVTAEQSGVLQKIVKREGDTVPVGEVLGVIGDGVQPSAPAGDGQKAPAGQPTPTQSERKEQRASAEESAPARGTSEEQKTPTGERAPVGTASDGQRVSSGQLPPAQGTSDGQRPPSPLARRVAAEYNVDLSQVKGTSPHGRVTREDVLSYMQQNAEKTA